MSQRKNIHALKFMVILFQERLGEELSVTKEELARLTKQLKVPILSLILILTRLLSFLYLDSV